MSQRGLVMVNTGDGKGKTTAAFGMVLRAVGHGKRVLVVQFMKGDPDYGEVRATRACLPQVKLVQAGLPTFVHKGNPSVEDLRLAAHGWAEAKAVLASGEYDLVVLDELNIAMDYGLIPLGEVLSALEERHDGVDVIVTGRYAPQALLDVADTVSEVMEVKHHYRRGHEAREGIEH